MKKILIVCTVQVKSSSMYHAAPVMLFFTETATRIIIFNRKEYLVSLQRTWENFGSAAQQRPTICHSMAYKDILITFVSSNPIKTTRHK